MIDIKDYDQIKDLITNELPIRIEINHRETIESVLVLLNGNEVIKNNQYQYKSNILCIEPRLQFKNGKNLLQVIVNPDNPVKKIFRFQVHDQIRNQWKMKVGVFPHEDSVIKKRVRTPLQNLLKNRFTIDSRVTTKEDFKQQSKEGCVDGFIACSGKQATLWSIAWDLGEITESQKPVQLVKKDNSTEYAILLKLFRIVMGNDTDMVPLKTCTGYLTLNNHLGDNLITIKHYLETTEENQDKIIQNMCEYLFTKLYNDMPVAECFISKILKEKQTFQPDINPKEWHIKKGMRMIVFKPTFTDGKEEHNEIAEAEVQWIDDSNKVEALLCHPNLISRINMNHRVILR
ncbi:MAG: hypothetical protein OMM_02469 [Candidatus Magnetoglobus multicellularis str. Araruama]|uniref:Uncharacterized protein n=1 Tax=Candidatus Magnetoglobus multicellularis str. Araruama TaxID=890399 RepID=A0A1V1P9H5_9BACT|nr:MAG: hypothetical protein OMM_02469 [Candidatus Magnetoglobus multicellularis str. Araruama]